MNEKEKVLRQIYEIKSHLVDKETFFPYNYNACHVWSAIAVILTLIMIPSYEQGIWLGSAISFVLLAIGFLIEGSLTKKVNQSYDIEACTKRQGFIMKNFLMISLFLLMISAILASEHLYIVIYLSWLFLISLGYFAVGFVLNIRQFSQMAQLNMLTSVLLLLIGYYFDLLRGKDLLFSILIQTMVIFGLALLPSAIAFKLQKEERFTKEACSV